MKVLDCKQSRELEQSAVDSGISYLELMENAGAAAVRFLRKKFSLSGRKVVILCGKGNNGGDGFVAARKLSELGVAVMVVIADGLPHTDLAKTVFSRLKDTSVKILDGAENGERVEAAVSSADFIMDAIYGTGFHGCAPDHMLPLFHAVQNSAAVVVSLDIPSGANCDSGAVDGECINADYTITFSTLKNGHLIYPAKKYCGQVAVAPIGIDANLISSQKSSLELTELSQAQSLMKPRDPLSNKGTYGRLLCICGSEGMAGAAVMSAKAAVRCGAGIVDVALPRTIYPIVASQIVEPVHTLLDYLPDGTMLSDSRSALQKALQKAKVCLIGCGLGCGKETARIVCEIVSDSKVPLIIDADGINVLAENINILKTVRVPVVLTPHPGEMARLMKTTVEDVQAHRFEYARSFAAQYNVILVLKGAGTLIAEPNGMVHLNPTGNAGMAKGGSGDVLAGMLASFIAQGNDPVAAAVGAVYLHGEAGDRCARRFSQYAMLPTDMIEMLPGLFLELER
ncbi:NAD(P)H-hydrate dehydratase [Caproiciproducens faecalis]|uniref:Bifunctional NAD(P)H-hydrate repair enzyme n=1 Tax=Caproiciproducens faecalis TaxID=2820301 RepID=A0ABS7DRR2_9FIRM|nr:NAD(P)H-hydrate dehydratase [Caproiciproducens faecalis]MBW7573707.1 NAD(P)H-hydrate dehydratase [Caproiciproducens faecalis]